MTTETSILGWLRSHFSNESDETTSRKVSRKRHRPIVELESDSHTFEKTFEYNIERTVELFHFEDSTLVIEYDSTENADQGTRFVSVTDVEDRGSKTNVDRTASCSYNNSVSTINPMAVTHREELGTIDVHVERPAIIEMNYDRVTNLDELPEDVLESSGVPVYEKVARNEDDDDFHDSYINRNGFTSEDDGVYWGKDYRVDRFTDDVTIETERNMAEVLNESIAGGTSNLRAASASGKVMLPDSEIGSGRKDVMRVQGLPDQ